MLLLIRNGIVEKKVDDWYIPCLADIGYKLVSIPNNITVTETEQVINQGVGEFDNIQMMSNGRLIRDINLGAVTRSIFITPDPRSVMSNDEVLEGIRLRRNILLYYTDWTDNSSVLSQEEKTAWSIYRQQLRDLPSNVSDIRDFDWPVPPYENSMVGPIALYTQNPTEV